jgi:hypothetical protein
VQVVFFFFLQVVVYPLYSMAVNWPLIAEIFKILSVSVGLTGGLLLYAWKHEKRMRLQHSQNAFK